MAETQLAVRAKQLTEDFQLPSGRIVTLIYGVSHTDESAVYLNGVRSGRVREDSCIATRYHHLKNSHAAKLTAMVELAQVNADTILSPPSCRHDAEFYKAAILQKCPARDVSSNVTRINLHKMADGSTKLEHAYEEFSYNGDGSEANIQSLLIVDDSISSGKTVMAILHHMAATGLPDSCKITVAAWANLKRHAAQAASPTK